MNTSKLLILGLVISLITTGCMTVLGTVTGPVAGIVTCVPPATKDIENERDVAMNAFVVFFSPIIGVANGFIKGVYTDLKFVTTGEIKSYDTYEVLNPCY